MNILFVRTATRNWRTVISGLVLVIASYASRDASAMLPVPFFADVDTILVEVRADPFGQTAIVEAEIAESARSILAKALGDTRHPISMQIMTTNDARILAPKVLSVLIHISVREVSSPSALGHGYLLASSVTLVRGDLKMPEAIPPMFLVPPEPYFASGHDEIRTRLDQGLARQLKQGIVAPIIASNAHRQ